MTAGGSGAITAVAVFCGASPGHDPNFAEQARALGAAIAGTGRTLIYGGGHVGLMGHVADGAVAAGGSVIGVIPDFLERREVAHRGLSELIVTDSMHARKHRMFALADAFIVFAGGLGTLDETFEILTWRQLGLHAKPVILCDVGGWTAPLLALIEQMIALGFARPDIRGFFEVAAGVPEALAMLGAPVGAVP